MNKDAIELDVCQVNTTFVVSPTCRSLSQCPGSEEIDDKSLSLQGEFSEHASFHFSTRLAVTTRQHET